jgi:hypothetical protein
MKAARDYTLQLWLLKLGAPLNVYFLLNIPDAGDPLIGVPARILFTVCAFRCLFPVRYEGNVVFHDSIVSSIFLTRLLATFAEVAYIFQFSYVLRTLGAEHAPLVSTLSWLMVGQVAISQLFVWAAILTGRRALYFYEELGWAVIFAANAMASAYLLFHADAPANHRILLELNLLFGGVYLPWQVVHLRMLRANAGRHPVDGAPGGLRRALLVRNRRTDAEAWGGLVGLSWMVGYWAMIIPAWVYAIVVLQAAY